MKKKNLPDATHHRAHAQFLYEVMCEIRAIFLAWLATYDEGFEQLTLMQKRIARFLQFEIFLFCLAMGGIEGVRLWPEHVVSSLVSWLLAALSACLFLRSLRKLVELE